MKLRAVLVGTCVVVGCSDAPRDDDPFGSGDAGGVTAPTGASATGSAGDGSGPGGSTSATSDTQASGTEDETGEEPIFDVGNDTDGPATGCGPDDIDCGCNAVDILFVVDNSGSMETHRAPVIAAFPQFVDEMVNALPMGTDLHVGLTRATGFYDPGNSGGWSGPACEATVTDGVFYPPQDGDNGENGQQGRLYEHDGQRYYAVNTGSDTAGLNTWFGGAMTGVIDGAAPHSNTETVVAGAAYPFHPANAAYNEGFMRTNAVLVLFLLSDSPDLSPPDIPTSDFVDIVSDAKAECGDMCIVTSGAIAGACYGNPANVNTRLTDFMDGFGGPPESWVDLSIGGSPDFTGVLGTALADVVAATCEQIPPEG
ncbi:MAG: hypothetical protein ACRBN8_24385 [Nannocystales bacterium]